MTSDKLKFVNEIRSSGAVPNLEFIIVINDPYNPNAPCPEGATHRFSDIIALGRAHPYEDVIATPDTLHTIVYTSGTTGIPKGALISHRNLCAGCLMLMTRPPPPPPGEQDYVLSYLPMAHILSRVLETAGVQFGAALGFFSGSMNNITDDILTLRPTILPGFPLSTSFSIFPPLPPSFSLS
jgi:long-subunit acyl-CoA synthetase (AMP-forming)